MGTLDTFTASVWNQYHGSDNAALAPHLAREVEAGVTLILANESKGSARTRMFREVEWRSVVHGQYRIAWDPARWPALLDHDRVRLSPTGYQRKGGGPLQFSESAWGILAQADGRTLEVVSYHTPAHVQVPEGQRPARRYEAFVESMLKLGELADDSHATAFLAGGDDNWDEDQGIQTAHTRPVFLGAETGLRQLQGGEPTFARREIDDFRIIRGGKLRPVKGTTRVLPGGGEERPAHRIHRRTFRWAD